MNIETLIDQGRAIVYDQDEVTDPVPDMFKVSYWKSKGSVVGSAPGRGEACFLKTPFGAAVLRRYRRGGWAARFSEDRYLFTGFENSRPFREFRLLAQMNDIGLPVPQPLAACCEKSGLRYRGALMTRTLANVTPLADMLQTGLTQSVWASIGQSIRRFHLAGVHHADLNARNVLLQDGGARIFLVDFDRGTMVPGRELDGRSNLARLRRSLEKVWTGRLAGELSTAWSWLERGYHE